MDANINGTLDWRYMPAYMAAPAMMVGITAARRRIPRDTAIAATEMTSSGGPTSTSNRTP